MITIDILSKPKEVNDFINNLKETIHDGNFSCDDDLIIIKSKKADPRYSTEYTMLALEFDSTDIAEQLLTLTIHEYSITKLDRDNPVPPLLYVFGKVIQEKLIYIKIKIKGIEKKKVLCLSFHFAQWPMTFPYAKQEIRGRDERKNH